MGSAKKIIIYGNGLYAALYHQIIAEENAFEVVGFTADRRFIKENHFRGCPLVAFEEVENVFPPETYAMLVIMGYMRMRDRGLMFGRAKEKGYVFENFISAKATTYKDLKKGQNNIVAPGVFLGPFGEIADNNIISPNVYIGHGFSIGSGNYIAPGCNIGGESTINDSCFIGIGATISDSVRIGPETLVGAGSLVLKNTDQCAAYVGTPAKKTKEHFESGITFIRK